MALFLLEGFEWIGTNDGSVIESELENFQYFNPDIGSGTLLQTSRAGYQGVQLGVGRDFYTPPLKPFGTGSNATLIVGFYWKTPAAFANSQPLFQVFAGVTSQCEIETNADGTLDLNRGGSTLQETSVYSFSTDTEYYVEFKIVIDDSSGSVVMKVADLTANDVYAATVTEWTSATSLDTKQASLAGEVTWNRVRFMAAAASSNSSIIDDIYICDASGSVNNDFLGNIIVEAIRPDSDGATSDFTPSTGSNFENVDDANVDDDTTYNESSTDADIDLYTLDDVLGEGDILGVQVHADMRVTEGDPRTSRVVVRSGTTNGESVDQTVANDEYGGRRIIFETNPDTSSLWTNSEVNSMQAGVKRQG